MSRSQPSKLTIDPSSLASNPGATTPSATTTPPMGAGAGAPPPPSPLDAQIAAILIQLDAIEASLDLDIAVHPNDKRQAAALARVSDAAITLAADIVSSAPASFSQFADLPPEAAYVRSMGRLTARVTLLASHVQKDLVNRRNPAAVQTLALYANVKSLGRIPQNEAMRERVDALRAEIAPKRKNPKPRITKAEKSARAVAKRRAAKLAKAKLLLDSAAPPPAPGTSRPPAPPPVVHPAEVPANGAAPAKASAEAGALPTSIVVSVNGVTPVTGATSLNGSSGAAAR